MISAYQEILCTEWGWLLMWVVLFIIIGITFAIWRGNRAFHQRVKYDNMRRKVPEKIKFTQSNKNEMIECDEEGYLFDNVNGGWE